MNSFDASLYNSFGGSLQIKGSSVYWINNGILVRKFTFSLGTTISCAIFTSFKSTSQLKLRSDSAVEDAIVIVTSQCVHVYYLSGPTFLVNLPCSISNVLSCDRGVIFSRDLSSDDSNYDNIMIPNFFLMSDPLLELGAIVSSSIASISRSEQLLYFGNSNNSVVLGVTFDAKQHALKVYSARHVNTSNSTQFPVKAREHPRRKSSRVSGPLDTTTETNFSLESSVFQTRLDHSLFSTRELSSYETADGFSNSFNSSSSFLGFQNIQKEVLLTLIESFHLSSHTSSLAVHHFSLSTISCIVVTDSLQQQSIFLTFECAASQKQLKFLRSQKVDAISVSPIPMTIHGTTREVALILTPESSVYFYDPFLHVKSDHIQFPATWKKIAKLSIHSGSIFAVSEEGHYNTEFSLEPHSELVQKCFKMLALLLDESDYVAFLFLWATILFLEESFTEWDSLVSAITILFIPSQVLNNCDMLFSTSPTDYSYSNQYSVYLSRLSGYTGNFDDATLSASSIRQQLLLLLFLIKEDSRLDVSLGKEVNLLEEILVHLLSWSGCPFSLGTTMEKTKNITRKFCLHLIDICFSDYCSSVFARFALDGNSRHFQVYCQRFG